MGEFAGISGKRVNGKMVLFCSKCDYIFNTENDELIGAHLMLCANNDRKIINRNEDR